MSSVESAVQWCLDTAADPSHGYDQNSRWGDDYDCSSFVITGYREAGWTINASYTGNMRAGFEAAGFYIYRWDRNKLGLKRGDILLKEGSHTVMYIGNNQFVEASINEFGDITGGRVGDQTGKEIKISSFYDMGWDYVIRWTGSQDSAQPAPANGAAVNRSDGYHGSGVVYEVFTDKWLGAVDKADDTDDGYAGWKEKPIKGIRACRKDGRPINMRVHMTDGKLYEATVFTVGLFGRNNSGDGYCGNIDGSAYIDYIICNNCTIRVAPENGNYYGEMVNGRTSDGDNYAGVKGKPIVAVQMKA